MSAHKVKSIIERDPVLAGRDLIEFPYVTELLPVREAGLNDGYACSNRISCAPFHSVILPSGARFSSPEVSVMK